MEQVAYGGLGGVVTAHAMDSASRWCRGGTQVHSFQRGAIRARAQHRRREQLAQICTSAVYVASDVIPVAGFHLSAIERVLCLNHIAESWRKPLKLFLDSVSHVDC